MDQNAAGSRVGGMFGPYELRALLGRGGMGEVYEAYDTSKDRTVALKLLSDALARDPSYQERFRRESRAAARLQEPHVIPIHDWGEIDGVLYIDMRLVPGRDLRAVLRAEGPLSPPRAVAVIAQIAAALDAAHADGLVHRDVKPENILINAEGFAYLVDFGIAQSSSDAQLTTQGSAIGSYAYMAPERFDAGTVDAAADTYSLTCLLHECLTGEQPFPRGSVSQLIKSYLVAPPPRPSQKPGVPTAFDEVIALGMAKQPQDRFPSTGGLAQAAYAALGHRDQGTATDIVEQTTPRANAGGAPISQQTLVGETLPQEPQPDPAQPYLSQPYPAQPYPAQPYPAQPYLGQGYPGQGYPAPAPHSSYPVGPGPHQSFTGQAPRRSQAKPVLLTLLAVLILGLGGAIAWVVLSDRSSADVENSASQSGDAPVTIPRGAGTPLPTTFQPTTAPPATTHRTTETVTTTAPAPTTRVTRPSTGSNIPRNVGVSGADGQGFLSMPNARCNESNPAVAVARTTKSYVVVCLTGVGRYYYKGVRAADNAAIEIDDPVPSGSGFTASGDGARYRLDQNYLTITDNSGDVLGKEPVVEFWSN